MNDAAIKSARYNVILNGKKIGTVEAETRGAAARAAAVKVRRVAKKDAAMLRAYPLSLDDWKCNDRFVVVRENVDESHEVIGPEFELVKQLAA